jgi:monoamine oxidase
VRQYDQYSLYEFLREKGWSRGAIEYFTVMNFLEADMHNALVEILREDIGGAYVDMQEIVGGMDGLPNAFYGELQHEVRLGAERLRHRPGSGRCDRPLQDRGGRYSVRGDYAVCTVPFSVLRTIEVVQPFSHDKRGRSASSTTTPRPRSCSRSATGSGRSTTASSAAPRDRPARPPAQLPDARSGDHRGVLLASTPGARTRSSGARWTRRPGSRRRSTTWPGSIPGSARSTRCGASHAWYSDRWARGAFAMFAPEQQTELQAAIVRSEGRILFAGEHCSLYHAWIQGALESGIRAAQTIHEAPQESTS